MKQSSHHKDQMQNLQLLRHPPIELPPIIPLVILSTPHLLTSLLLTQDLSLPALAFLQLALDSHRRLLITRVLLLLPTLVRIILVSCSW